MFKWITDLMASAEQVKENPHLKRCGYCHGTGIAAPAGPGYTIDLTGEWIKCHGCQRTSYNPGDVENRYCGNCGKFHLENQKPRS